MSLKARVCRLYGQNDIRIEEIPVEEPGPGQVLLAIGAGGICGSDLHYYRDGGFGPIRVREPIIPGHEAAGTVVQTGPGVKGLKEGDRVAVNPSQPCRRCRYCKQGLFIHCLEMSFLGSAMYMPHVQGLFREMVLISAEQCCLISPDVTMGEAACAEPLAVCLHARHQAGDLEGRKVLVMGSGPIGSLCTGLASQARAAEIVVADLEDVPLSVARAMGATKTINLSKDAGRIGKFLVDKGYFDVCFECSAAAPAVRTAIEALHPKGLLMQLGVTADLPVPVNLIVQKEIVVKGSHRFHHEFAESVDLISSRRIDVRPVITHTFLQDRVVEAFETAGDRSRSVKVHLSFENTGAEGNPPLPVE